jgi:uncharacterized protein involved in outer membrane biogenesis
MPRRRRRRRALWPRLLAGFVFELVSAAIVVGLPGVWLYRHMDLARLAAAQASAITGRAVTIGSLKLGLGRTVTIDLSDAVLPNLPGGSAPAMATLKHLVAEADLQSLIHGPLLLNRVAIDGLDILLERVGDARNWRFGPPGPPPADPTGRTGFPSLRDVTLRSSQVVFRTGSGNRLVTALDNAAIKTAGDDQPVTLSIAGAYNAVPLELEAGLQSIAVFRDRAKPFGTTIEIRSGALALNFDGTITDPLNVNGISGRIQLDAPDPKPLFGVAGVHSDLDTGLRLQGTLDHHEPQWRLADATGRLGQDAIETTTIAYDEGAHGQPDRLDLNLGFKTLNLNELAGTGARGKRRDADVPLQVEQDPATLIHARVSAGTLDYATFRAEDVTVQGAQTPGLITVDALSLKAFGTELTARGRIEPAPSGAHVTAAVSALGADVQTLRQAFGFGSLPLTGRLDIDVAVDSTARTVNAATHEARISAVAAMRGGAIQKNVIEMASTDIRALFRTDRGMTPITCLLAGLDMRAGIGTVAPLRVRAGEGTISGSATFDLDRHTFDLTIGSEAKSTGLFALDIPIRVAGSFGAPVISPAQWTAQGRAMLAAADNLSDLPPVLREYARRYPCPPSR